MIEEHNHEHNHDHNHGRKKCWCKYAGIVLATLIGAFLAFYFIADMTLHHMMNPMYHMNKMDRKIAKEFRKADMFIPKSLVLLEKDSNAYKIFIDLKAFDADLDDIDILVEGQKVTISGEIEKEKRNEEKVINFVQTFYLDDVIDSSRIKKEEKRDKFIITLPIKK